MNKRLSVLCVAVLSLSLHVFAQNVVPADHRTQPDKYFLNIEDVANSLKLLPPPPEVGSIQFMYDDAQYHKGKMIRNTDRGQQAVSDAKAHDFDTMFSQAFGCSITPENTPEIYKLLMNMKEDAGDLATRHAKVYYMRPRPFMYFNEETSVPGDQKVLSTNGSFPSGHTAIGWASALVLAEINVENQDAILKRGYEMGQSRVITGYHFQSDVDAARLVSAAVVARLHAHDAFNEQLQKAKAEYAKLKKEGKIKKVEVE